MIFAFRVDCTKSSGMGHYSRALRIAKELKKQGCTLILIGKLENLEDKNLEIWNAYHNTDSTKEAILALSSYPKSKINLIIDNYSLEAEYEKEVGNFVKNIIVIEDLPNRQHYCDIFINWNVYAKEEDYTGLMQKPFTKILCGLKYLLLDNSFVEIKKQNIKPEADTVFLFLTGGDDKSMTLKILKWLEGTPLKIEVVIGSTNQDKENIISFAGKHNNINLHIESNNMAQIMAKCTFAIGAFGQSTYERLFLNIPTIGLEIAENQKLIAEYCIRNKLAINLGYFENITKDALLSSINNIKPFNKLELSANSALIISLILSIFKLTFKSLTGQDSKQLLNWRNKPHVRRNMRNRNIISQEEHDGWFASLPHKQHLHYFIFQKNYIDIGLINFNINPQNECTFGLYIGEENYIGKGLGIAMLSYICFYAFDVLNAQNLQCSVLKQNLNAYSLYKKFCFTEIREDDNEYYLQLKKLDYNLPGNIHHLITTLEKYEN